jgi:hypothetical protein
MQRPPMRNPTEPSVVDIAPTSQKVASHAKRLSVAVTRSLSAFGAHLASAVLWFQLLHACGAGFLVAGVYVLAGLGWSLIAAGILCIGVASFLRKGMTGG